MGILLVSFLTVLVVSLFRWYRRRSRHQVVFRTELGIGGPTPVRFLSGNLKELNSSPEGMLSKLMEWFNTFGRTFTLSYGPNAAIYTTDTDVLRDVMVKKFEKFRNRQFWQLLVTQQMEMNLLGLLNEDWRRIRRILNPVYTSAKLRKMNPILSEEIDILLSEADKHSGGMCDIYDLMCRFTLDTIGRCALGTQFNSQTHRHSSILTAVQEAFNEFAVTPLSVCLPEWKPLWKFVRKYLSKAGKYEAEITAHIRNVIKERINQSHKSGVIDALQLLVDAAYSSKRMSEDEMVANAYVFVLGGYDTTSVALSFAAYLLSEHPEQQDMLHDELTFKLQDCDNYDMVMSLPYLDAVWKESLRMYPPAAGIFGRQAEEDTVVGDGMMIPKKAWVLVCAWALHYDEEYWTNPHEFRPERWLEADFAPVPMSFLPFGAGPRHCIGAQFAQMEFKMALAKLVLKFKMSPCEKSKKYPMKPVLRGPTVYPDGHHIWVKLEKREQH